MLLDEPPADIHAVESPEIFVKLSPSPPASSFESDYTVTTQNFELSPEGPKAWDTQDTTRNDDDTAPTSGSGFIVEDL
jgi:hypothetical protein